MYQQLTFEIKKYLHSHKFRIFNQGEGEDAILRTFNIVTEHFLGKKHVRQLIIQSRELLTPKNCDCDQIHAFLDLKLYSVFLHNTFLYQLL